MAYQLVSLPAPCCVPSCALGRPGSALQEARMRGTQRTPDESGEITPWRQYSTGGEALIVGQVLVGIALGMLAGLAFQKAMVTSHSVFWWAGAVCLLIGGAAVVSAITGAARRRERLNLLRAAESADSEPRDPTMPMLGALLVYKYQIISEGQLQRAMELQRKHTRKGRHLLLGQVLSEMGLVTPSQLDEALEYQQSRVRAGYWMPPLEANDTEIIVG